MQSIAAFLIRRELARSWTAQSTATVASPSAPAPRKAASRTSSRVHATPRASLRTTHPAVA
jgi:hypothetical protein